MKIFILISSLTLSFTAFAGLSDDFEQIKKLGRNLEPTGAICEEVARLRFSEKFPEPEFRVVTGIEYSDKDGTLGELDVVVFNNETQIAQVIAEVKCWTNAKSGLKKAKEQRHRFLTNVKSSKALKFRWMDDPKLPLTKTQFNKASEFYFIAQSGTQAHGFDYELPYSLNELMQLRKEILVCQSSGKCPKPK